MTNKELRSFREKRLRMTQIQLADALGSSSDAIQSWEQGRRPIKPVTVLAIKHLLCEKQRKETVKEARRQRRAQVSPPA